MIDDTIVAISTPLGEGGIGIVRLSGKDAVAIVEKFFSSSKKQRLEEIESHRLIYGFIKDPETSATVDEVLVSVMKEPRTYTRENIVEINCHSGILPLRRVLELALNHGARLAEPGEFTKRAFLNGRIDLSQAEAVIDLIRSKTDESTRVALEQLSGGLSERIISLRDRIAAVCAHIETYVDFPEEEIEPQSVEGMLSEIRDISTALSLLSESFEEGRFLREGLKVAIVGKPNVGKSSLLNALLKRDRAIVTEIPGTTRDVLEEYLNIKGLPVRIMDTAGIRETHEMAEKEGVRRSLTAIDAADIVIAIIDGSSFLSDEDVIVLEKIKKKNSLIVINKSDICPVSDNPEIREAITKVLIRHSRGSNRESTVLEFEKEGALDSRLRGNGDKCGLFKPSAIASRFENYSDNLLNISAKTGAGLDLLKEKIVTSVFGSRQRSEAGSSFDGDNGAIVTNIRHKVAIDKSVTALDNAYAALKSLHPLEIIAVEMRDALDRLGEIVGAVTTEDILNMIFSEFCIGK